MKNEEQKPYEGFQDAINKERFTALMTDFIQESTDEEAIELWKMITNKYPSLALRVILDKIEKTRED